MTQRTFWVYLVASAPRGYLYVGFTNDLARRIDEHKHGQVDGYTREHGCDQLVWYERHTYADRAIKREKQIKRWLREWKFALVEEHNPQWRDLYSEVLAAAVRPAQP